MSGFLVNKSLLDPTVTQYSGGTASFTLPQSGTTNSTQVLVGGVEQVPGVDFTVSGTALTLTTSAPAGSNMVCARQYFADGIVNTPADNSVSAAKIPNDALDSQHYAAASIDLEHMSSQSVDEDNLHISNAGTNGQFLSKQSGNAGGLTWADAGGGAWNVISSQTGSGVASINFTSGIDSTYEVYCFVIAGLHPANDAVDLKMLASTDGGSSYLTSGYLGASTSSFGISQGMGGVGNANDEGFSGRSYLYIPSNTSLVTMQDHTMISKNSGGNAADAHDGSLYNSASAVNAVQFKFSGGNIDSGRITLYGIAHS